MRKKLGAVGQQKIRLAINTYFSKQYLDQTKYKVDNLKYIKEFEKTSRKFRDLMLDHSIKNLALADGVNKANEILVSLGFDDAEINIRELINLTLISLRVQVLISVLKSTKIPDEIQKQILNRFIFRLLPLRDNAVKDDARGILNKFVREQIKDSSVN